MTSTATQQGQQQQQPAQSQPLPPKEQNLFRQVVKFYENKQYKKAIKAADQVLKKFPEHGETLAMKGLTVNNMDKKDEAYELVRRGLKADLKSHVCWHVYGLLYRSDREYREAIKCYLNALRIDKDNLQILRDLANLQVQMRDLPGYVETRHQLLTLKSNNRNNWISFAVAHHINGNHNMAVQILESYERTLDEVPSTEAYEHSEMLMYKAQVLMEAGRCEEALAILEDNKDKIRDRWALFELRALLLLLLGRRPEAESAYLTQLALNPDHYKMHEGLQRAMGLRAPAAGEDSIVLGKGGKAMGSWGEGLSEEQRTALASLYRRLQAQYPRSSACKRIPLDFLQGAAFLCALDAYVRPYLRKGVPSLFVDLRPLYRDRAKVQVIQALFERYSAQLRDHSAFPPLEADGAANGTASSGAGSATSEPESPQTRVWVLYFLAQHYDYLGRCTRALDMLDEAMRHTPTAVELYSCRSKVLRHAGDPEAAAHLAESARRMDLSDRFLNSASVKALLAADRPEAADLTAALFVRDAPSSPTDPPPSASATLYDMQHMWYEVAAGEAHWRLAGGGQLGGGGGTATAGGRGASRLELGRALKKFVAVTKHFDDIHEDQFDFHGYCMRKMTLRAYIAMLRMEDKLYGQQYYLKACLGAIRCYLALHDAPAASDAANDDEAALAGMSAEERKKFKLKRKKEEKQRAKEEGERKAREEEAARARAAERAAAREKEAGDKEKDKKKGGGAAGPAKEKDPDPDGQKLAACEDPLAQATKLVAMLKEHAGNELQTHLAAFEVYRRKGRLLLALSAVQRAAGCAAAAAAQAAAGGAPPPAAAAGAAGASHPDVHVALVRLAAMVEAGKGAAAAAAAAVGNGQQKDAAAAAAAPPTSPVVERVVREGLAALLGGMPLTAYCAQWAERWAPAGGAKGEAGAGTGAAVGSLEHRVAAATAAVLLEPGNEAVKAAAMKLVLGAELGGVQGEGGRLEQGGGPGHAACMRVHQALLPGGGVLEDAAAAAAFKARCQAAFPHSAYFEGGARVQYQRYELDNMVEAFGRLSF